MTKDYNFSVVSKIVFYFHYIFYKCMVPFEVYSGRKNVVLTEIIWILSKLFKFKPFIIKRFSSSYYITKFGKFYITPDLISTIAVSPSFERREMDMLIKLIVKDLEIKNRVLFIDIGAFFGLYTVAIGSKFKNNKNLDIISFEPGTSYLSKPTFELLRKNVSVNKLKRIKIYKIGLGSINSSKENAIGFKTKKLDSILSESIVRSYDKIYIKLDVDGYEKHVLDGAKKVIKDADQLILLVEDFVDDKIIGYLKKQFIFMSKPSVYNSFWIKK